MTRCKSIVIRYDYKGLLRSMDEDARKGLEERFRKSLEKDYKRLKEEDLYSKYYNIMKERCSHKNILDEKVTLYDSKDNSKDFYKKNEELDEKVTLYDSKDNSKDFYKENEELDEKVTLYDSKDNIYKENEELEDTSSTSIYNQKSIDKLIIKNVNENSNIHIKNIEDIHFKDKITKNNSSYISNRVSFYESVFQENLFRLHNEKKIIYNDIEPKHIVEKTENRSNRILRLITYWESYKK